VVAQTMLGVVLLVGAGLVFRSFASLVRTSPGFNPANVLTLRFGLPDAKYPYEKQIAFYDDLLPAVRALPGVRAAAGVAPLPLSGNNLEISFERQGEPRAKSARPSAAIATVSPGYFGAMGIEFVRGRDFTVHDGLTAPRVVIVNESFARRYFPNEDPLGKQIKPGLSTTEREVPWRQIVGIVRDVKIQRLSEPSGPAYYVPYAQGLITSLHIIVRTEGSPLAAVADVRKAIVSRDRELAVADVRTMDEYLDRSRSGARFDTVLLGLFAALGLGLTGLGLYGVTANTVAERTHEFGVHMALGATAGTVLKTVLRQGLALAATGLVLGIGVAVLASRLLVSLLYDTSPFDAATFAGGSVAVLLVALLACFIPARRATSVNPIAALRQE
jgi:putative ABC transport system permease protein